MHLDASNTPKSWQSKMSLDIAKYILGVGREGTENHSHLRTMATFLYLRVAQQINSRIETKTQKVCILASSNFHHITLFIVLLTTWIRT